MKFRAAIAAGVLAASSVAFGVAGLGTPDGGDVAMVAETDNLELLSRVETGRASDVQFQRRGGTQQLDGETIDAVKDYAFVGTINGFDGFAVVDVTDPTQPELLTEVRCGGSHNDIAVWEQYVVLGHRWDRNGGTDGPVGCDGAEDLTAVQPGPGIWIFDATDPANPDLVRHIGRSQIVPRDRIHTGPRNISINPEAGHLVFSFQALGDTDPRWGYLDLTGDVTTNEPVVRGMRDMGFVTTDGCNDQSFAHGLVDATGVERDLLFCAAGDSTLIWDITADPTEPQLVADIVNPAIGYHHGARLAPDGRTLVINNAGGRLVDINDGDGGLSCTGAPTWAQFAYDISVPEHPVAIGHGSTDEPPHLGIIPCTSHFYNFIASDDMADGSQLVVSGWLDSGLVVHDFSRVAGVAPIGKAPTYAQSTPEGVSMWSGYAYRGHLYGTSFGSGNSGLFVYALDGYTPAAGEDAPGVNPWDEGTVWGRWTGGTDAGA